MAAALIKDSVDRIMVAMREGRFSRDELEVIALLFEKSAEITRKTIARGPKTQATSESNRSAQ